MGGVDSVVAAGAPFDPRASLLLVGRLFSFTFSGWKIV